MPQAPPLLGEPPIEVRCAGHMEALHETAAVELQCRRCRALLCEPLELEHVDPKQLAIEPDLPFAA